MKCSKNIFTAVNGLIDPYKIIDNTIKIIGITKDSIQIIDTFAVLFIQIAQIV